jgi:hypothetical protein
MERRMERSYTMKEGIQEAKKEARKNRKNDDGGDGNILTVKATAVKTKTKSNRRGNTKRKGKANEKNFSLTVITMTVYMAVFEYQNQVIFNMTVFDGGPSLSN